MAITATIQQPAEGLNVPGKKSLEPILKTENLWKLYRAGKVDVPALRGVNFAVAPGESVAVMGPSGCGKSSLLYVIGGLAQASKGHVLVDGNQTLFAAHALTETIEGVIQEIAPRADVTVHPEPYQHEWRPGLPN